MKIQSIFFNKIVVDYTPGTDSRLQWSPFGESTDVQIIADAKRSTKTYYVYDSATQTYEVSSDTLYHAPALKLMRKSDGKTQKMNAGASVIYRHGTAGSISYTNKKAQVSNN